MKKFFTHKSSVRFVTRVKEYVVITEAGQVGNSELTAKMYLDSIRLPRYIQTIFLGQVVRGV